MRTLTRAPTDTLRGSEPELVAAGEGAHDEAVKGHEDKHEEEQPAQERGGAGLMQSVDELSRMFKQSFQNTEGIFRALHRGEIEGGGRWDGDVRKGWRSEGVVLWQVRVVGFFVHVFRCWWVC